MAEEQGRAAWEARYAVLIDYVMEYADGGVDVGWWDCPRCSTQFDLPEDAAWCAATDCFKELSRG